VPGTLDLTPLWDLLKSQPGFAPELALPPLCKLKSWERELNVEVALPAEMGEVGLLDQRKHAAACKVPDDALAKALSPPPVSEAAGPAARGGATNLVITATETPVERKKRGAAIYLAAFALLGLVASGIYTFGGEQIKELSAQEISTEIPLMDARRSGEVIGVTLSDRGWLGQTEEVRRKQVENAFEHVRAKGATGLVIMDEQARIWAQATLADGNPVITVPK
jgi:hypothetical protein